MIKVVLFDVDGVLIDSAEANCKFHSFLNKKFGGRELTLEEYKERFFSRTMKENTKECCPNLNEKELEEACRYGAQMYPTFHKYIKIKPHVVEILKILSKKFRLGIVTGRVETIILKDLDIEKYFEHQVTIKDYKNPKPHPEPLLVALKKFGVKPEEAVYVGDQWNDAETAKNAGLKSIIYGKATKGDYNIEDLLEIPTVLKKLIVKY